MAKTPMTIPSSKVSIALAAGAVAPAMKAADAATGKLYNVPLAKIKTIPGFNVRVDSPDYRAHRDMIADSMRANGYDETKPLAGYVAKEGDENVIYVTDGHTRLDAASIVAAEKDGPTIDKLPVIVRATAPSLTDLTVALHTNNTGRPLSPFELGVVVKRLLKEDGADKKAIAARLAVTPRYLDDVLLLVNSPKEVRTAVLEGNVASTFAIQELRKAGDAPEKAVERITAAVAKAKASGKTKATAKDAGPKLKRIKTNVSIATGTDMKEIVKAVAAQVRAAIAVNTTGEGDDEVKVAAVDGTITVVVEVPAPEKPKKPAPAKKPAAKKPAAAKPAAKAEPAAKKPAAKKAAAKKPAAETPPAADEDENISADEDEGLGIEGAEEVTSEGQDDEEAILPPKVETVADDEEVDI